MEIFYVYKMTFTWESLQEIKKHLLANHMSHLIQKGERNEEDFGKNEIIDIIRLTGELIVAKHGYHVDVRVRKAFSASVNKIFPKLSIEMIDEKLGQRMRNMQRPANQNKCKNKGKISPDGAIDFEDFVECFNVQMGKEDSIEKSSE